VAGLLLIELPNRCAQTNPAHESFFRNQKITVKPGGGVWDFPLLLGYGGTAISVTSSVANGLEVANRLEMVSRIESVSIGDGVKSHFCRV